MENTIYYNPLSTIVDFDTVMKVETVEVSSDVSNYESESGIRVDDASVAQVTTFKAPKVVVKDVAVTNDGRMKISSKDVKIDNLELDGEFNKATMNAVVFISDTNTVNISGIKGNQTKAYNGIEIANSTSNTDKPKSIIIKDCDFSGPFDNNAINVFDFEDGCTMLVENCHFAKVSNMIRLSNNSNNSIQITVRNCQVDAWETKDWSGMFNLQDYTSTEENYKENNRFAPEKVSITIENCTGPNGVKITSENFPPEAYGSKQDNQLMYVYVDPVGIISYDPLVYPKVTIR